MPKYVLNYGVRIGSRGKWSSRDEQRPQSFFFEAVDDDHAKVLATAEWEKLKGGSGLRPGVRIDFGYPVSLTEAPTLPRVISWEYTMDEMNEVKKRIKA